MPSESSDNDERSQKALRLEGITKRFGELVANDKISVTVRRGEILALLGENGAGKTTLMNILFGHYVADSGTVEVFGTPLKPGSPHAAIAAGIGMVHQHFTLADNLTVLDNVVLGTESLWRLSTRRREARQRLVDLAKQFGFAVDPGALIANLSVGERQHVEILKVLFRDARILVLDEPTAVLVPHEVDGLFTTLRKLALHGVSIIFISHKLREVMAIADRIVVLRRGRVVAECQRATVDPGDLAELMVGQPIIQPVLENLSPGESVLRVSGVTLRGKGNRTLLDDVDLDIHQNEIVGVAGVSGNGQSLLADVLSGLVVPDTGTIEVFGNSIVRWSPIDLINLNVARIPEDRHATGLYGDMSIWENIIAERYRTPEFARGGFQRLKSARQYSKTIIAEFDIRCPGPEAVTRLLSGGNMQKLILGRTLSRSPKVVIANQPTRGLDVGAASYVHRRLIEARAHGAGVLLISDDLDELLDLSDRVVVMYRGQVSDPIARGRVKIRELSLQMAGQGRDAN